MVMLRMEGWPGPPPRDLNARWTETVKESGGRLAFESPKHLLPWLPETFVPDGLHYEMRNVGRPNVARLTREDGVNVGFHLCVTVDRESLDNGDVAQEINTERRTAVHDLYYLPWAAQGRGHGSEMFRRAVLLWEALGVEEVRTRASEVGKYVWAMCGFDFASPGDRDLLHAGVAKIAPQLGVMVDVPRLEHPWEYVALGVDPETGDEPSVGSETIARATGDPTPKRAPSFPLGKALLLFAPVEFWDGKFDMRPGSPSRRQFEWYAG